jgi:hypothetical protein
MSDPRYMHEFWPNKKGLCKRIVGCQMCHEPEDAEVHQRFVRKQKEDEEERVWEDWLHHHNM